MCYLALQIREELATPISVSETDAEGNIYHLLILIHAISVQTEYHTQYFTVDILSISPEVT